MAVADCRRCPTWTFRWTPRLIQHISCKTITKRGPRDWEADTGTRSWLVLAFQLAEWRWATHSRAHVAHGARDAAQPPTALTVGPPSGGAAAAMQAALAANPGPRAPDQASVDPSANVRGRVCP